MTHAAFIAAIFNVASAPIANATMAEVSPAAKVVRIVIPAAAGCDCLAFREVTKISQDSCDGSADPCFTWSTPAYGEASTSDGECKGPAGCPLNSTACEFETYNVIITRNSCYADCCGQDTTIDIKRDGGPPIGGTWNGFGQFLVTPTTGIVVSQAPMNCNIGPATTDISVQCNGEEPLVLQVRFNCINCQAAG